MARRKLPWAADGRADEKLPISILTPEEPSTPARTPKREHLEDDYRRDVPKQSPQSEPPQKRRRRAVSRSPSTSPPPEPPGIYHMIEGYDCDDGYMMVEDEFCTVAQSFTAHLHHAEYKRLMLKAQQAPPKPLPELSASMSQLAKQKLARRKLEQEQKAALRELGINGVIEEQKEHDIDEVASNTWQGTSLAVLMASGSQQKTSLVGLDKIPSTTRAAKGYQKGRPDPQSGYRKGIANKFDMFESSLTASNAEDENQELTSKDKIRAERDAGALRTEPPRTKTSLPEKLPKENEFGPRSRTTDTKKPSILDGFDDYDEAILDPPSPPAARSKSVTQLGPKRKNDVKKDRRSRLDEVPVFL